MRYAGTLTLRDAPARRSGTSGIRCARSRLRPQSEVDGLRPWGVGISGDLVGVCRVVDEPVVVAAEGEGSVEVGEPAS